MEMNIGYNQFLKDKKEEEEKGVILAGLLFVLILALVFDIGLWFLEAVVVMDLWNWFVLPVTGFKFGYWQMFGALLIPTVLCLGASINNSISKSDNDASGHAIDVIASIIMRTIFLLIFWGIGAWIA
jgi:hypothetical protein